MGNKRGSGCTARSPLAPLTSLAALNNGGLHHIGCHLRGHSQLWGWCHCGVTQRGGNACSSLASLYTQSGALALEMELWTRVVHLPYSDMPVTEEWCSLSWAAVNLVKMAVKKNHPSLLYGIVYRSSAVRFRLVCFRSILTVSLTFHDDCVHVGASCRPLPVSTQCSRLSFSAQNDEVPSRTENKLIFVGALASHKVLHPCRYEYECTQKPFCQEFDPPRFPGTWRVTLM